MSMGDEGEEASQVHEDAIVRQLEHEDGLMVNRLSWLVASQSFLFTAYAIALNGTSAGRPALAAGRQGQLMQIVPALGLATCGVIYLSLMAGIVVTMALRRDLRKHLKARGGVRSRLQGNAATHAIGLAAPLMLPPIFFVAWVVLLTG